MALGSKDLQNIDTIHVMPGLYCNFFCSHCVNDSGPKQTMRVSSGDLSRIKESLSLYSPPNLQFTGGEPTFFSDEINDIIEAHPNLEKCCVQITTNGWYADSVESIQEQLGKFKKLDFVLLSFDKFHSSKVTETQVGNLLSYCKDRDIKFCISMCITDPREMLEAKSILSNYDADVIFQKVDSTGRAKNNGLAFKYPSFEAEVLEKKCPNLGSISFIAGKGFTACCSNLVFNNKNTTRYAHKNANEHISSDFHLKMANNTFKELLVAKGIDENELKPEHSSPCSLCEYIWEGKCSQI